MPQHKIQQISSFKQLNRYNKQPFQARSKPYRIMSKINPYFETRTKSAHSKPVDLPNLPAVFLGQNAQVNTFISQAEKYFLVKIPNM